MSETSRLASGESTHPVCVLVFTGNWVIDTAVRSQLQRNAIWCPNYSHFLKKIYFLTHNFSVFDV